MANSLQGFVVDGDDHVGYFASFPLFNICEWESEADRAIDAALQEVIDYVERLAFVAEEDWKFQYERAGDEK